MDSRSIFYYNYNFSGFILIFFTCGQIALLIGAVSTVYFLMEIDEPKLADACKKCVINIKRKLGQIPQAMTKSKF